MKSLNIDRIAITKAAAQEMMDKGLDYWPVELAGYEPNISLYAYADGVWLVDTKDSCNMGDAVKLIHVLAV